MMFLYRTGTFTTVVERAIGANSLKLIKRVLHGD
jgi:hypothetical protein